MEEKKEGAEMQKENSQERFPLFCNGKSFGTKYQIDAEGKLWDARTGVELAWDENVPADLSKNKSARSGVAKMRKFSRLIADDGSCIRVNKAVAIAWSVSRIADGRKQGLVPIYLDGDMSNETAANLLWGTPRHDSSGSRGKKLSGDDVKEILASFNPFDMSNNTKALADRFGVATTTINNVVSFKDHRYVDRKPFTSNPHISQVSYFDTYVPSEDTILGKRHLEQGKPVKPARKVDTSEQSEALVANESTDAQAAESPIA